MLCTQAGPDGAYRQMYGGGGGPSHRQGSYGGGGGGGQRGRPGGLQVLGKVRQKPLAAKPVALPSMRRENKGVDPRVAIVPTGGGGWGTKTKIVLGAPPPKDTPKEPEPTPEPAPAKPTTPKTWGRGSRDNSASTTPNNHQFPTLGQETQPQQREYTLARLLDGPRCSYQQLLETNVQ